MDDTRLGGVPGVTNDRAATQGTWINLKMGLRETHEIWQDFYGETSWELTAGNAEDLGVTGDAR